MAVPVTVIAIAAAAVVPVPADVVVTDDVVAVSTVVFVTVPTDRRSVATGEFWSSRRTRSPSLLTWLASLPPGGSSPARRSPSEVDGLDPVETALLLGAGIARGRANAAELGYTATMLTDALPPASLAVALRVYDAAGDLDVSAGRHVLALGTLDADGMVVCPPVTVDRAMAAMPSAPDLVLVGAGCDPRADDGSSAGVPIVEVSSLEDAVLALTSG